MTTTTLKHTSYKLQFVHSVVHVQFILHRILWVVSEYLHLKFLHYCRSWPWCNQLLGRVVVHWTMVVSWKCNSCWWDHTPVCPTGGHRLRRKDRWLHQNIELGLTHKSSSGPQMREFWIQQCYHLHRGNYDSVHRIHQWSSRCVGGWRTGNEAN